MKILLLGEKSNLIFDKIVSLGHNADIVCHKITVDIVKNYDFIISFGYRYIIKQEIIDLLPDKIINLHISMLPYNKGADPNLWSYLENSPKGVTIHKIDKGLDTGDIILQKEVQDDIENDTLATSYDRLIKEIVTLFNDNIYDILNNSIISTPQYEHAIGGGDFHYLKDKEKYMHLLTEYGWDTPVKEIIGKGIVSK